MNTVKKKCRVVIFDTEEFAKFEELSMTRSGKLELSNFKGKNCYNDRVELYILNKEPIKPGDWYEEIFSPYGIFRNCSKEVYPIELGTKVIASTDSSLNLPQPSQSFIQKYIETYNSGKPIEKVMVEYEYIKGIGEEFGYDSSDINSLKVNPKDNTIFISNIKDSWDKEELREIFVDLVDAALINANNPTTLTNPENLNKWIEENL